MSKISIEGNALGSGTFTIASPNSNTSRTLTLPDNTGTIVTQNSTPAFASTIGVGGATPSTSGAGITFPADVSASTNANTLDDYEEGTWTPTLNFSGNSAGMTYSVQLGRYIKCGNIVTLAFRIRLTAKGSSSGGLRLGSVPFAPSQIANLFSCSGINVFNLDTTTQIQLQLTYGDAIPEYQFKSGGTDVTLTQASVTDTTDIRGLFTYITT
jgi:hypothetical protein